MFCSKCGSNLYPGDSFCTTCGNKTNNNQGQQAVVSTEDDALINAYIGHNAEKLREEKFNLGSLFFGMMYSFYRKMWKLGLIWFGIAFVLVFLGEFGSLISLVGEIVVAFYFNKWYVKHVKEEVTKIKNDNLGSSQEELLEICRKKGGTTFVPIVILIVFYVILFIAGFILGVTSAVIEEGDYNQDSSGDYSSAKIIYVYE